MIPSNEPRRQDPALVIFDMDGTLTRSYLDFDQIREEIGLPNEPILEAVLAMPPEDRSRAEAILLRHERAAAAESVLQDGAAEVVAAIRWAGLPVALMTRNSRESVRAFQRRHGLAFDLLRAREDGPMKPSPAPVLDICRRFEAPPQRTWVIGDFHFDLLCANAAGAVSVLFLEDSIERPAWATEATHVIRRLHDLPPLLGLRSEPRP